MAEGVRLVILEWVSVFLVGLCLGLSVAILVVLWRVWGTTDRIEQAGKERLEIVREQQERLGHLREEREILLEELKRLREQKERLRWLQEGRAGLLAELKRLRSRVEEEKKRAAMGDRRNGHAASNSHVSSVEGAKVLDKSAALGPVTRFGDSKAPEATQNPEAGGERSQWWRRISSATLRWARKTRVTPPRP